jgi:hypothetical protein
LHPPQLSHPPLQDALPLVSPPMQALISSFIALRTLEKAACADMSSTKSGFS